jgi:cell division protein FtsB
MFFLSKKNPVLSTIILFVISVIISSYFIAQIFVGQYSATNLKEKEQELQSLIYEYEKNNEIIEYYKDKIKAFDPENVDVDYLEEEMKRRMGVTKKNEIIILLPEKD